MNRDNGRTKILSPSMTWTRQIEIFPTTIGLRKSKRNVVRSSNPRLELSATNMWNKVIIRCYRRSQYQTALGNTQGRRTAVAKRNIKPEIWRMRALFIKRLCFGPSAMERIIQKNKAKTPMWNELRDLHLKISGGTYHRVNPAQRAQQRKRIPVIHGSTSRSKEHHEKLVLY